MAIKRLLALVLLVCSVLLGAAWAQTESVLYRFCEQNSCADGQSPQAGVVFDPKGNLYGTTLEGGAHLSGVVFELTAVGNYTVLHSFCKAGFPNCADGSGPAGVLLDPKGNLYGTTGLGGNNNKDVCGPDGCGVEFKLTPEGKYFVYNFCTKNDCTDGGVPQAGLVSDQKGNLYGTTRYGGGFKNTDAGTVFRLTPAGRRTVLYSFCSRGGFTCSDGRYPFAPIAFDQKGNLYGTTIAGGAYGYGVVYKLTPAGKETTLHTFCAQNSCPDGAIPYAGVVFDQMGNLYGTASQGGAKGQGAVFKITPAGKYKVLYSFCLQGGFSCSDGQNPRAPVVFDQKGNLYGTASDGGAYGGGVVFKISPAGKYTVVYSFCAQMNCSDGANPAAGLVFDRNGNLYGTTANGGQYPGGGVIFKLTP
jgi:uncharacterized repeat protein (TIGR03803 family)